MKDERLKEQKAGAAGSSPAVRLEVQDHIAEVILARPERKNAINGPLGLDLAAALKTADTDPAVHVVLLRGDGGAFCSGIDLNAFNADPVPDWLPDFPSIWRSAHRSLFECRKPLVCALERYAINGGAALALAADLLFVGRTAWLQIGEARLGMAAPYNLAWASLRLPESAIARLVFMADRVSGPELLALGIAHRVADDEDVLTQTRAFCAEVASWPEGGLSRIKSGIRARLGMSADDWFDRFAGSNPVPVKPPLRQR